MSLLSIRLQLSVLGALLSALFVLMVLAQGFGLVPTPEGVDLPESMQGWSGALFTSGGALLLFGALGGAGLWLARRVGLPGIFRPGSDLRARLLLPLALGAGIGIVLLLGDRVFIALGAPMLPHPKFPGSVLASGSAAIGEEVIFRLFVMSLWAFLLNLALKRHDATIAALWIANFLAAVAFAAGHLPAAMLVAGVDTPAEMPGLILAEMFLLNGILGLAAGERFIKDGLVAAIAVHLGADLVWHVLAQFAS